MTKNFNEYIELTKCDNFRSLQQSAIDIAIKQNGGIVDAGNALQIATDISALQSLNLINLYHAWVHGNPEQFVELD